MDMGKESRPKGPGGQDVQAPSGSKAKADSQEARTGSPGRGFYVNERGQVCYGNDCITLAVDEERREVIVNIKPTATCDIDPFVEAARRTLGKGARTVYEVESVYQEDKPK